MQIPNKLSNKTGDGAQHARLQYRRGYDNASPSPSSHLRTWDVAIWELRNVGVKAPGNPIHPPSPGFRLVVAVSHVCTQYLESLELGTKKIGS